MKTSYLSGTKWNRLRAAVAGGSVCLGIVTLGVTSQAQTVYTYYTGNSNAYLNASHWTVGGVTATKFPGLANSTPATTAGANGTTTDIADFGAINAANTTIGINFNSSSNNGVTTNAGANGTLSLGAFDFLSALQIDTAFGNSSTTATATGILTFNGSSLNGVSDTIISNEGTHNVTFAPSIVTTGTVKPAMAIALGDTTTNTIQANGTGNITFSAVIQNGAGNGITINSGGSGAVIFSGANTYTGTTTITKGSLQINGTTGAGAVAVNGGTLAGTGTISGAVTVASAATIQGGVGAATGSLTLTSPLTLNTGSIIQLALGSSLSHSTLATAGATFDPAQTFKFLLGASTTMGTYTDIITGLTSDPGTENNWVATATDGNFMGSFAYDGAGGINLTVTSVPEPTTILGGVLLLAAAGWSQRRRLGTVQAA